MFLGFSFDVQKRVAMDLKISEIMKGLKRIIGKIWLKLLGIGKMNITVIEIEMYFSSRLIYITTVTLNSLFLKTASAVITTEWHFYVCSGYWNMLGFNKTFLKQAPGFLWTFGSISKYCIFLNISTPFLSHSIEISFAQGKDSYSKFGHFFLKCLVLAIICNFK